MDFRFSEKDHAPLFWQCAQMPVISTTDNFGAKPVARAAASRPCAIGTAGISPTEPQRSQIRNATIAAVSWSWAQARYALRLSMRWTRPFSIRKSSARYTVIGAYEVIDELAKSMPRPAPITVYRALDFLIENGLVHRIESRNAFLACAHDHDAGAMVAFLICERCGSVGEIPAAPVAQSLNAAARASGFSPKL